MGALDWPVRFQFAEVHFQHDHAQHRAAHVVDPPRQVQAGLVADGAQREMLGRPMSDRALEVGAELVVDADEGGGFPPVAGGDRPALLVQHVDRGGADPAAERVEFFVQGFDLSGSGVLERGAHVDIAGEHERQRPEFVEVVAQQGRVDLGGAARLRRGIFQGAVAGPEGGGMQHAEDDAHPQQNRRHAPRPGVLAPPGHGQGGRLPGLGGEGRRKVGAGHGVCGFSHILYRFCVEIRHPTRERAGGDGKKSSHYQWLAPTSLGRAGLARRLHKKEQAARRLHAVTWARGDAAKP
ncbi:hypothetical protein [Achromobacter denitrificans]|uniref:hypothetical protein n=1 Tax=Achromobacter denitrificans TaxID=32002 RepID=UPI0030B8AA87